MARTTLRDHRKPLRICQATWDREDATGRSRLAIEAGRQGYRLVVVSDEGAEWAPADDPAEW